MMPAAYNSFSASALRGRTRRRSKKRQGSGVGSSWLITFADLVTLLLTFFVLLLSMSSLSLTTFIQVSSFMQPRNFISHSDSGQVPQRIQLILEQLHEPESLEDNKMRLKDLMFPHDVLPDEMDRKRLMDNLDLLLTEEGVVIVMTESLLFGSDEFELSEANRKFLAPLYDVLLYSHQDINIAGHTDNQQHALGNYELSGLRALAVLDFFLYQVNINDALKPNRLSISAYGPDRPLADNATAAGRAKNGRVEILLKNEQWLGRYP